MPMTLTTRVSGIRPGSSRNATNINSQLDAFQATLGTTEGGGSVGQLKADNFSKFAGIQETKVNWDTSGGHRHVSASGDGAELASNCIGDLQTKWHASKSTVPKYARGAEKGMIIRYGIYLGYMDKTQQVTYGSRVFHFGGGYTAADTPGGDVVERTVRIYYSTGHIFQRHDPVGSTFYTTENAGSPFPQGCSPVVTCTLACFDALDFAAEFRPITSTYAGSRNNEWQLFVTTITSEYFDLKYHFSSLEASTDDTNWVEGILGVNWVAIYDPTVEAVP